MTGKSAYAGPVTDPDPQPAPGVHSVLRAARQAAGLSQEELAERSGMSVRTISNIERGRIDRPRRSSLEALADALELAPEQRNTLIEQRRVGRAADKGSLLPGRNFLPRRVPGFTGRGAEIDRLRRLIESEPGGLVCSVDGMAGVGKTALVVQAAHALAPRFPDGLLFLDLHGYTPGERPLGPSAALAGLLRQVGVPGERTPQEVSDRAALWRREMAGLQAVVVLDNAATEEQVAPLLTDSAGCVTLVTSRRRLIGLDGAVPISLGTLPGDHSRDLFTVVAGSDPADAAVEQIVVRCAHLPLAIRIAAARLRHRPSWMPTDLLRRLSDRNPLSELDAGDQSVAAAFGMSYQQLPPALRRAFRLLGAQPMATFDSYATAAVLSVTRESADRILEELVDVHLVEQSGPDRYQFHDLLRIHARGAAEAEEPTDERREASRRLLDYLLHVAMEAGRPLDPYRREYELAITSVPAAVPQVAESDHAALAWLEIERTNLLAVVEYAAAEGWDTYAWQLAWALRPFYDLRGYQEDWITSHELAAVSARRSADPLGEGITLSNLSQILRRVGRHAEGHERALRSLELAVQSGDLFGQAVARSELGQVHRLAGEYEVAARYSMAALTPILDEPSDVMRHAKAIYLSNLAVVYERLGRYQDALRIFLSAIGLFGALNDRDNQGLALRYLGVIHTRLGDPRSAAACFTESLGIARDLGDRLTEGRALGGLGGVYLRLDRPRDAAGCLHESLAVLRSINARPDQVATLATLGSAHGRLAQYEESFHHYRKALQLADELDAVDLRVEILNNMGGTHFAGANVEDSRRCHDEALQLAVGIGLRFEQARAYHGLGRCATHQDDSAAAARHLQQESIIWQDLGVPAGSTD